MYQWPCINCSHHILTSSDTYSNHTSNLLSRSKRKRIERNRHQPFVVYHLYGRGEYWNGTYTKHIIHRYHQLFCKSNDRRL